MSNPDPERPSTAFARVMAGLAMAGLTARLVLACISEGSNDARLFRSFAEHLRDRGMHSLLREVPDFNHPPLVTLYAVGVLRLSEATGIAFPAIFKLPLIAADAATMLLLWRIGKRRAGPRTAALAGVLFAWSLNSILVTGYHCNTDSLYAFLVLLAAWLAEERGAHFGAGLALAAGINVKLLPAVLVPAFLAACRTRWEALRLAAALAVGAIPFLVMLLLHGSLFFEQVIDYTPRAGEWGIVFLLRRAAEMPSIAEVGDIVLRRYRAWGKYLMLVLIMLAAIDGRRLRWNRYRAAAVAASLFLVFTPGVGVQYTVLAVPLLFAVSVPFGAAYSFVAGVFLLMLYVHFWTGSMPLKSSFSGREPLGAALVGLAAWGILIAFIVRYWVLGGGAQRRDELRVESPPP